MTIAFPSGSRVTPVLMAQVIPLSARRISDQSLPSSTTLTNDNTLFLSGMVASAVYEMQLYVLFRAALSGSTPGMKVDFTLPSGASISDASFEVSGTTAIPGANGAVGLINCATSNAVLKETGLLVMSGSTGTLQFRFAQQVSSASAVTIATGSYLKLHRLT